LEVSLTPEHEEYIARSVESGEYPSAADALNDAVEELRRRHDYRAYVRKAVAEGVASLERGEGQTFTMEELREHFSDENMRARSRNRERLDQAA
jgi:putative addiction module CopG family antidote